MFDRKRSADNHLSWYCIFLPVDNLAPFKDLWKIVISIAGLCRAVSDFQKYRVGLLLEKYCLPVAGLSLNSKLGTLKLRNAAKRRVPKRETPK